MTIHSTGRSGGQSPLGPAADDEQGERPAEAGERQQAEQDDTAAGAGGTSGS